MGVYIKIEMPKSCCECFAFKSNVSGQLFCKAKRIAFGKEDAEWLLLKTPDWCPLVPVPPHGRLIDADALMLQIQDYIEEYGETDEHGWHSEKWCAMKEAAMAIESAPTIIPAEPAEEGE